MSLISPTLKKNNQILAKKELEKVKNTVSDVFNNFEGQNTTEVNIFVRKTQKTGINENFIMVIQDTENVICQILTNAEFRVFGFMRSLSKYNNEIHADINLIADSVCMADRSVKSAIKKLASLNIISIQASLNDKRRNFYIINPQSSWKGVEEKRKQIMKNVFNLEPNLKVNQLRKNLAIDIQRQTQLFLPLQSNTDLQPNTEF